MTEYINNYPDLKINGRLFPLWIMHNFKKYKIDPIIRVEGTDPCNIVSTGQNTEENVVQLRKYQAFVGSYLDYRSPFKNILIYHGLGSGKTATAINIYNLLYNYNPNWNLFILTKASLKDKPWMVDLNKFLPSNDKNDRMKNIKFIHYDAPNADKQFIDAVKSVDVTKKNIYIFEEAHNFIKNVYNNIVTKKGKRAFTIYDYIYREKKENDNTRVILMSGTPVVNNPFELALMFNLMRPDIFPLDENEFNEIYITTDKNRSLNPINKNMFQRRIMGLVSFYYGSTKDVFAEKNVFIKNIEMSEYQQEIYDYFENIEDKLQAKRSKSGMGATVYRSYTRQGSNFIFPIINDDIKGENRPRPNKYKIKDKDAEKIMEGKLDNIAKTDEELEEFKKRLKTYLDTIDKFVKLTEKNFIRIRDESIKNNNSLEQDIEIFKTKYKYKFSEFWKEYDNKSEILKNLYNCSCKITAMMFYIMRSKGPILIYSNYVKMEGLEMIKIYLRLFSYTNFNDTNNPGKDFYRYTEFHGEIDREIRSQNLDNFNNINNIFGKDIKIILISPAGSEGISLANTRQVHILEPYWNEVRMEQVIGRAIRQCSHKDLPFSERYVDIFRYFATRNKSSKKSQNDLTTDQDIYELAKDKAKLNETFLLSLKEIAVDCELFKNDNMYNTVGTSGETYKCFKFTDNIYFEGNVGPAYKDNIYYDQKINNGLNSIDSINKKIKVIKIKAVKRINEEISDEINEYWYNPDSGIVYDLELDYPIGRVYLKDGVATKLNQQTYIIDKMLNIPLINVK